jgi:hypothetical protein
VLIDPHANPGALSPAEFAQALTAAGLSGAIIARAHRSDDMNTWFAALEDADLVPFAGVELHLDRGRVVFVPDNWEAPAFSAANWGHPDAAVDSEALLAQCAEIGGALIASHPYCRELGEVMGDRVYRLRNLTGIVVKVGCGQLSWDTLAESAATAKRAARLGSSNGIAARLGFAATVVPDEVEDEAGLMEAFRAGLTFPIEFDDPTAPRDRSVPLPPRRDSGEDGERGPRRDDDRGDRGPRREGGDRGDRGPRREGGDRGDRGPRREGGADRGPRRERGPRD